MNEGILMDDFQFDRQQERQVFEQLLARGWRRADILSNTVVTTGNNRALRPDFVLAYNLYPLAVVEVVRNSDMLFGGRHQGRNLSATLGLPFAITTNGRNSFIDTPSTVVSSIEGGIPTPQDLLRRANLDEATDPRVYPPSDDHLELSFPQMEAIGRTLDAVAHGQKNIAVLMASGTGILQAASQILWKLVMSGHANRALVVAERSDTSTQFQDNWIKANDRVANKGVNETNRDYTEQLSFTEESELLQRPQLFEDTVVPNTFDVVLIHNVRSTELLNLLREALPKATFLLFSTGTRLSPSLLEGFGLPVYRFGVEEALVGELFLPLVGYKLVTLSEIADVDRGLGRKQLIDDSTEEPLSEELVIVSTRQVSDNGNLRWKGLETARIEKDSAEQILDRSGLQENDIVLGTIYPPDGSAKVGLIDSKVPHNAVTTDSLVRIRVDPALAKAEDVYSFLRSDRGKEVLRAMRTGTVIGRINLTDLRQLPIFLPEKDTPTAESKENLTSVSRAIVQIREHILPLLEQARAETSQETEDSVEDAATRLRDLADTLSQPNLEDRVIAYYPAPIAIPYRHYLNSQFNVYEKVSRLKDVFESIGYFVYSVMLADVLRNIDASLIDLDSKWESARDAYSSPSLWPRLLFIERIQNIVSDRREIELFMPELLEFRVDLAKTLQNDFRNPEAHKATSTDEAQLSLVEKFEPLVIALLEQLSFLSRYRLVRIRGEHFSGGNREQIEEVYNGLFPQTQKTIVDGSDILKDDKDHLLLLSEENVTLDLFPLYQVVAPEEIRYQRQIAYLRWMKVKERQLLGESVQGAFTINLEGFDELNRLRQKLLAS